MNNYNHTLVTYSENIKPNSEDPDYICYVAEEYI